MAACYLMKDGRNVMILNGLLFYSAKYDIAKSAR